MWNFETRKSFVMRRWLRVVGTTIAGIILLLAVVLVLFIAFISPNNLKPIIEQQVHKLTGRTIVLHGDIHWVFFPSVGLRIAQAEFGNAKGFDSQPFAMVNQVKISVKLLPLFRAKVDVDELMIDGVTLNLMRNKESKTNWQDLVIKEPKEEIVTPKDDKHIFDVSFPHLDIKNVTVNWRDLNTGEKAQISHLNFRATHIQTQIPFPIKLSMDVHNEKPRLQGQVVLVSKLQVQPKREHYQLEDLRLNVQLRGPTLPDGKLNADLRGSVDWISDHLKATPLRLTLNESNITGHVDISDVSKLTGEFGVTADRLNLDQWMFRSHQSANSMKSSKEQGKTFLIDVLQKLNIQGKFRVSQLKVLGIRAKQVYVSMNSSNGILTFSPVSARLYEGAFSGATTFNMRQTVPTFHLKGNFKDIAVQPLLSDLKGYKRIFGMGNLKIDLVSRGLSASSLNGSMSFNIKNGVLKGIDVVYLMKLGTAVAFKRQVPPLPQGLGQTDFGDLTGTASIKNGVIYNNDLRLISEEFEGIGRGTIDLVAQKMDYNLDVNPINNKELIIPLEIKGPFANLKKGVDMERLLLQATKWQIEKRKKGIIEREEEMRHFIEKKIKSTVKGVLNGANKTIHMPWKHFFHDTYASCKNKISVGIGWVKHVFV
jgi:AsmA protein